MDSSPLVLAPIRCTFRLACMLPGAHTLASTGLGIPSAPSHPEHPIKLREQLFMQQPVVTDSCCTAKRAYIQVCTVLNQYARQCGLPHQCQPKSASAASPPGILQCSKTHLECSAHTTALVVPIPCSPQNNPRWEELSEAHCTKNTPPEKLAKARGTRRF